MKRLLILVVLACALFVGSSSTNALVAVAAPIGGNDMNEGQDNATCEAGYIAAYGDHIEYCLEGKMYWIWR